MKDKIRSLLGAGISPKLVASAVGCTESYISQLLSQDNFALEVATIRCQELEAAFSRDKRWDSLEDTLLEKLTENISLFMRPKDILQALAMINGAKRRSADLVRGDSGATVTNNIVVLQLPSQTVREFSLNKNNEIISVDQRALVAMPTSALLKELHQNDDFAKIPAPPTEARIRSEERVLHENSV